MKFNNILILSLIAISGAFAQSAEYVYRNPQDSTYNCYLKLLPKNEPVGLIIRDYSSLPDTAIKSPYKFTELALANDYMVVYTNSSNYFPELYFDDSGPILLDEIIHEVLVGHPSVQWNIFIGGISASGTRALRYTMFCNQGKSKRGIKIRGAFAVDSPLDNERFYRSAFNHQDNFKKGMKTEAELMLNVFPEKLGGSPDEKPENYLNSSVYSYSHPDGGNVKYFKNQALLIFHEPDIEWWLEKRGSGYFDINSFDLVGFVNDLKRLGNKDVELITTSEKGFKKGKRNCHSWTIVDEEYLLKWIISQSQS